MKNLKLIPVILLGLLCSCHPVNAQNYYSSKPVVCGPVKDIIDTSKGFGERPLVKGEGTTMQTNGTLAPSQYVIGFNKKTGSWTLIEILATGHACVLGTGTSLVLYSLEDGISL